MPESDGRVEFEVRADLSKIDADMAEAGKKVSEAAQKGAKKQEEVVEKAQENISQAVKKANDEIENDNSKTQKNITDTAKKQSDKVCLLYTSRQSAMRECIGEMTQKGIPAFVDKNGRNWTPEAYTNMCIRSTVGSVAKETQFSLMDEYGLDLIEVSSHSGARPLCAKDQGKIFNRNGGGGYTTDLDGKRIKFYAWRSSSYGKPAGLLGINCGHQLYPFLPGISVQTYFPYDEKENAEQYEKICNQRALERKVRASKRECTSLDTLGDLSLIHISLR